MIDDFESTLNYKINGSRIDNQIKRTKKIFFVYSLKPQAHNYSQKTIALYNFQITSHNIHQSSISFAPHPSIHRHPPNQFKKRHVIFSLWKHYWQLYSVQPEINHHKFKFITAQKRNCRI